MKMIFSAFFIFTLLNTYAQDSIKIKKIDALVAAINNSGFSIQRDTIKQESPEIGIKMITYLTMLSNGSELLKYINDVDITMTQEGFKKHMGGANTFYFEHNKLIKVEEYMIEADQKKEAIWYFSEDKPLYYTLQSPEADARAFLLLSMAKTMVSQFNK